MQTLITYINRIFIKVDDHQNSYFKLKTRKPYFLSILGVQINLVALNYICSLISMDREEEDLKAQKIAFEV